MISGGHPARASMLFLAGMVAAMTAAHIMFKFAGNHSVKQVGLIDGFVSNPWLWAGLLASGIGMVCWLLVLRKLPLATAYPWTALIFVFTPLVSMALFGDVLSEKYLLGMAFIVTGVVITTNGTDTR